VKIILSINQWFDQHLHPNGCRITTLSWLALSRHSQVPALLPGTSLVAGPRSDQEEEFSPFRFSLETRPRRINSISAATQRVDSVIPSVLQLSQRLPEARTTTFKSCRTIEFNSPTRKDVRCFERQECGVPTPVSCATSLTFSTLETWPFSHHQHLASDIQDPVLAYIRPKSLIACFRVYHRFGAAILADLENFATLKYSAAPSGESQLVYETTRKHGGYHH
jgi:hypothetical protein